MLLQASIFIFSLNLCDAFVASAFISDNYINLKSYTHLIVTGQKPKRLFTRQPARSPQPLLAIAKDIREGVFVLDDFLCQRAVQTQLYYFAEFRDGFKRQWLERFGNHDGLKDVHSFGALSDAKNYLEEMLHSPSETHEIRQQWGNRFTGGSKNNPFLKPPEERFTSYNETIAPQKICKGILEIREQLAQEWIEDLELLPEDDDEFLRKTMYFESQNKSLEEQAEEGGYEVMVGQSLVMAGSASTPLRVKNYDLLKKAGLYVASRRMSRELERNSGSRHAVPWFRNWREEVRERLLSDKGMLVADRLLSDLLRRPSMAIAFQGSLRMLDPPALAREVLRTRREVCQEWREWLASDTVRQGHAELMRGLLLRMESSW